MEYVIFTEEEKERAGAVNLVEFLLRQGEELEPSGSEWRWKRHDSVTVRNNTWYRPVSYTHLTLPTILRV